MTDLSILDAMSEETLFAPHFKDQPPGAWVAWKALLAAVFGLPMDVEQMEIYQRHTGRETAPSEQFDEAVLIIGRRGGKSRVLGAVAVFIACFRSYDEYLAPGEVATVAVLAADRRQARSIFRFTSGLLNAVDSLRAMIVEESGEQIVLNNRVIIEIGTSSFRSTRGYSYAGILADEVAYWRYEDSSANPDVEVFRALRPGMANIPGSIMMIASSPHAKRGELFAAYKEHYGKDDAPILVWKAPTLAMHNTPRLERERERAFARDHEVARAEWDAEFRDDLADYIAREVIEAITVPGRLELPPIAGVPYSAFVDPSAGTKDSMALAIAHQEGDMGVLDVLLEIRAPYDPDVAVAQCSALLKRYGVSRIIGDRFAGQWPVARFAERGVTFEQSARAKSAIYGDFLPLANSGRVELLDNARLTSQFCGLERRTNRSGSDSIAEPKGSHDDCCNVVAGVLVGLDLHRQPILIRRDDLLTGELPGTIEHPHCFNCIVWITPDGRAAVALFSYEITPEGGGQMALEWFDTCPWYSGLLLDAARRMDVLCDAAKARSYPVKERGGAGAFLLTQRQLLPPAVAAMREVFSAKLEVETYRSRRVRNVNVLPIGPAYAADPARLVLGAAGHVASGTVKLSAEALSLAEGKPLLGNLAVKPGEAVDAEPLRMALLIGIAQLDAEWGDENGSAIRFG